MSATSQTGEWIRVGGVDYFEPTRLRIKYLDMVKYLQTHGYVVLVSGTWYRITEKSYQAIEGQSAQERKILKDLLLEIKDHRELDFSDTFEQDVWKQYKTKIDFLPGDMIEELRIYYRLISQINSTNVNLREENGPSPYEARNRAKQGETYQQIKTKVHPIIDMIEKRLILLEGKDEN